MSTAKKIGLGIALLVLIALMGGYAYVHHLATRGIPDYDGKVPLDGLNADVTVYRDQYAVPHIYAGSERDLYMAVGYCMAQDRLFQMDLIRRVTTGSLSEVIGEKTVKIDHLMRALRIPAKSRLMKSKTDPPVLRAIEAFCEGVNRYIDTHRSTLPVEFAILGYVPEKWKPAHAFNVAGYMAFDLSTGWKTEAVLHKLLKKVGRKRLEAILPDIPANRDVIYPEFVQRLPGFATDNTLLAGADLIEPLGLTVFSGSNNWVVSGKKSVTGKPILANDMHLGLNAPGIWYQMHQVAADSDLDVTGVVVPGQPFVTAGHNTHMAWGFTNVMVDDMDFYLERIHPEHPDEYEFNGQWRKMTVRTENIRVKGGAVIEKTLRFTHRGPVISELKDISDSALSMRWAGNAYSNESRTLYLLARAQNWEDFKNAVRTFNAVSQNVVYADIQGNIGLYCSAGVPIRPNGTGWMVMPGWTDQYDWQGFVPFEKLPHSYNPESGVLVSANNKTVGDDYPYYISAWFAPGYRFRRINEMLAGKETFSIDDFKHMQGDWQSQLVADLSPAVIQALERFNHSSDVEKQAVSLFAKWDGVLSTDSAAAAIFETFYIALLHNLFEDEMGGDLFNEYVSFSFAADHAVERMWADRESIWYDNVDSKSTREGFDDIVLKSFRDAVAQLTSTQGDQPGKWRWGAIHRLTLTHPLGSVDILDKVFKLNRGPYAVGGSAHTVSPYKYKYDKPFDVYHGASHRHIYSLADWNASLTVIPTGTCGVPASPHYCDQTERYLTNRYHADVVRRDLVAQNARHVMTLSAD